MKPFHEYMDEYRNQMAKGDIREAYRGLMEYIAGLRLYLKKKYPDYVVSGSIYPGYMDMTYFSFSTESLRRQKLKIAVVFLHDTCRFEVWLAGYNKQVQTRYWELLKEHGWNHYRIPLTVQGSDSILEYVLVEHPDFRDITSLTTQIEAGILTFIKDIEDFLSA